MSLIVMRFSQEKYWEEVVKVKIEAIKTIQIEGTLETEDLGKKT